ncbi:MAG: PIN domain-containing protein [Kofleriaceae bacterium]|nr:PIN domain-containing protein [Kofleriaceae bacterium]
MAFAVVLDACVLHPPSLRDFFIRIAQTDLVRARWSERILDECFRSILRVRPKLNPEALQRTRDRMNGAVRDVLVAGYEGLETAVTLPDPDDRHVVAAAIKSGAQAIVTFNLKDFPASALSPWNIEAKHPDEFVLDLLDLDADVVADVVRTQVAALRSPPRSVDELLGTLRANGLPRAVEALRERL